MCGPLRTQPGGDTCVWAAGDGGGGDTYLYAGCWGGRMAGTPMCGLLGTEPGRHICVRAAGDTARWGHLSAAAGDRARGQQVPIPRDGWQHAPRLSPSTSQPRRTPLRPLGAARFPFLLALHPPLSSFAFSPGGSRVPDPPEESVRRVPGCCTADRLAREVQLPCCTSFSARSHNPLSWVLCVVHNQQSSHR